MSKTPEDDDLQNLFVLQYDMHLPRTHKFFVEWLLWFNRAADDPVRTYEGLWELSHDWIRLKKESKNRRDCLKDHFPGAAFPSLKGGKGTGKDKNGQPQVCFAWRNTGICKKKDEGSCVYAHPADQKNTWKPSGTKRKGKSKDGKQKRSSSTQSRGGKGDGRGKSTDTPRGKAVTDPKLLCQNYLKGKCSKGNACTYHHNGVCSFNKKGLCNKGDKCVFSHHDPPALAAKPTEQVQPSPRSAAAKAKAEKANKKE